MKPLLITLLSTVLLLSLFSCNEDLSEIIIQDSAQDSITVDSAYFEKLEGYDLPDKIFYKMSLKTYDQSVEEDTLSLLSIDNTKCIDWIKSDTIAEPCSFIINTSPNLNEIRIGFNPADTTMILDWQLQLFQTEDINNYLEITYSIDSINFEILWTEAVQAQCAESCEFSIRDNMFWLK